MISLPVYDKNGKEVENLKVDESAFGGRVRYALLKQAIVMYNANKRVGTAATKSRGRLKVRPKRYTHRSIPVTPEPAQSGRPNESAAA